MDVNIKKELIEEINQLNIKKEEDSFLLIAMAIPALRCSALTELTTGVQISNIDAEGITVSGDGVSHKSYHDDTRRYIVWPLKTANRVVIKQMIKKEIYEGEGLQFMDEHRFDLKVDFELGTGARKQFTDLLDHFGYNN